MKIKRVLNVSVITILSISVIILLYLNALALAVLLNPPETDYSQEKQKLEQYKLLKWEYDTELKYNSEAYCRIQQTLPDKDSSIGVNVYYHKKKIPIQTALNPYPEYTNIYEVGIVNANDQKDLDILFESQSRRLYRIELIEDPDTYLEYVSDRNDPYLYIVKDERSSEFLIYPILLDTPDQIDHEYYIEII